MTHTYDSSSCNTSVGLCCKRCTGSAGKSLLSKDLWHIQKSWGMTQALPYLRRMRVACFSQGGQSTVSAPSPPLLPTWHQHCARAGPKCIAAQGAFVGLHTAWGCCLWFAWPGLCNFSALHTLAALALLTQAIFQHEDNPGWREENKANQPFPGAELAKGGKEIVIGQGQVSQAAWASRHKRTWGTAPSLLLGCWLAVLLTALLHHPAPLVERSPGSSGASTPGHAVTFASVLLFPTHRHCLIGSAQQVLPRLLWPEGGTHRLASNTSGTSSMRDTMRINHSLSESLLYFSSILICVLVPGKQDGDVFLPLIHWD